MPNSGWKASFLSRRSRSTASRCRARARSWSTGPYPTHRKRGYGALPQLIKRRKPKMTRKLLATLAAGAAALIVASGAACAQSVSLTLAHQYPSTQPIGDGYNLWAKRVEELSNGDIKVQVFPGSTLIGSDESFNAVSTGSVSASNMIGGFQAGDIPELASITMPFLFDDYAHYKRAVDGGLRELVASWYEAKNIKLLSFFPKGNDQVFHKSKFLLTPEDFAGAQIRGVGGASD